MIDGTMTATTRYNDRSEGFNVGDSVTFKEGESTLEGFKYTGREFSAIIGNVDDFGCQPGYVTLSLTSNNILII